MYRTIHNHRATLTLVGATALLAGSAGFAASTAAAATAALPPANATVAVEATGMRYTGLAAPNNIVVTLSAGRFLISDTAPITAGEGCQAVVSDKASFSVSCLVPIGANGLPKTFRVQGGAGDDRITNRTTLVMRGDGSAGNDILDGGAATDVLSDSFGGDTLRGNGGNDTLLTDLSQPDGLVDRLEGGGGDDDLQAGPTNDILRGGSGRDTMRGGLGADDFDGGPDSDDAVVYLDNGHHFDRVVVVIDDIANDGLRALGSSVSEGDNVRTSVEDVFGSHGNDVILGSSSNNNLSGNLGNDVIEGGLGQDEVEGGPGNDTLASNRLFGVPVNDGAIDTVDGGSDSDHCRVPFVNVEADIIISCESINQD